jgi:protein-tyrosine phosphatase
MPPMTRERILFVCTANVDRSPTAEDLYRFDPRYEVRSAGLAAYATRALDLDLVNWADRVFVMSERCDRHRSLFAVRFPGFDRPLIDLDVEDRWSRGDPELVKLLRKRLGPHLGEPRRG